MPTVNLELQLKFLRDLDVALDDALVQYRDVSPDKLGELSYMKQEVERAKSVIGRRLSETKLEATSRTERSEASEISGRASSFTALAGYPQAMAN